MCGGGAVLVWVVGFCGFPISGFMSFDMLVVVVVVLWWFVLMGFVGFQLVGLWVSIHWWLWWWLILDYALGGCGLKRGKRDKEEEEREKKYSV